MIPNYRGTSYAVPEVIGEDPQHIMVYNNTGSAIANGTIYDLVPMWITGKGVVWVPITPAENTAATSLIGIVDNNDSDGIDNAKFGKVLVKGMYGQAVTANGVTAYGAPTGTVAANDHIEVIAGGSTFIDAGTNGGTKLIPGVCGIVVAVIDSTHAVVYLFGRPHTIVSS